MSPGLEFQILGPFEVRSNGHPVDLGARRQRALLAVLLLHANEVVSRDLLIEEVWGEGAPASAPNMIQVYVSRLRKALGDGSLLTQAPGYVLRVGEAQLDAIRFAALVARAGDALTAGGARAARELLEEAIALWRGPALADFTYESFAQGEVGRLEELRLEAIELRADADLALGRHSRLVGELEQLVALHPFRERLRAQLMLALYRSGRQAEALDAYRSARQTLVGELGIDPSPGLQRLEQAILTQDRELDGPAEESAGDLPVDETESAGNLAPELTTLIGRDADIERVAELVSEYRLVSVVGTGGVGKTRVAQRVARNAGQTLEHGAWFVDLAAIDDGDDVAGAVMAAVGVADRTGSSAQETLVAELRTRRLLLLLDNCEHLIRSAAELAARLVSECHCVSILATSREPLAVTGERVARVEPLSTTANASAEPPAAVALFLDRAASHGASCAHDDAVLETIREVCVRLDGIPLAIELAAARSRAISPAELLVHLDDRLRLLTHPRDWTTPARQQTLEATIAWSYELLGAEDQVTLRRLSVFHGSFSLTAAVAVCTDIGAEIEILERVTGLVDRSVVSIERRGLRDHYRLLESIALFAQRRLRDEGEDRDARDRHARYFLGFAQDTSDRSYASEPAARAERLDAEQDNLTAALGWCLDGEGDPNVGAELAAELGWHWVLRGRSNVAKRWLERALELGDRVAPPIVAAVYVAYAGLTYSTSDLETSRSCASEAVGIARKKDDRDLLGEALGQVACACRGWGNNAYALKVTAELRALQPFLSAPRARSMSLIACAQVALFANRFSPDGSRVLTACRDGAARLWDWRSGRLVCPPLHHALEVWDVGFTPDGKFLATASVDGTARVWESLTGRPVTPPLSFGRLAYALATSRDGRWLTAGGLGFHHPGIPVFDLQDLSPDPRIKPDQLQGWSELVACQRIHETGNIENLSGEEWLARWKAYRHLRTQQPSIDWSPESQAEWHARRALACESAGDSRAELWHLDRLLERQPRDPQVLRRRGRVHLGLGQREKAIADLSAAINLDPADEQAWSLRGSAELGSGQTDRAIADFTKALKLAPEDWLALTNRGIARASKGATEAAVDDLSQALRIFPENLRALHARAQLYQALGLGRKALADYEHRVEISPDQPVANNNLAWLLATSLDASLRDPKRAVELAQKAVQLAPKEGGHWNTLGVAHFRAGDWKAAIEALTKSMELSKGGDGNDWFFLAMAHWQLGAKTQARSWYEKAVPWMEKNQPKNEELVRFRAEAAALLGVKEKKD